MVLRFGQLEMEYVDSLENGVIRLYNSIKAAIRQKYSILLDEEDIDNIILERGGCYKPELKERVREVAIGYVTELLGSFVSLELISIRHRQYFLEEVLFYWQISSKLYGNDSV